MLVTVTGTFSSLDQLKNAEDDLIALGIPREKLFMDKESKRLKVMTPEVSKPEILEILNRHQPQQIS